MRKLVIDRSLWFRGEGESESRLLNSQKKMCCLGFLCQSFGASDSDLYDIGFPSSVWNGRWLPLELLWLKEWNEDQQNSTENVIGAVNDDPQVKEPERETYITKEFAKHDLAVTFIN